MSVESTTEVASEFLRVMQARGYIHQCTDAAALDAALAKGPITAYVGYDCTADSLHIGHLISIMMLRWLQKCGHQPIVLMGGGTTKVGDPTDKDQQRPLLSEAIIAANMASIQKTFAKFLTFGDGPTEAVMVDNAQWLDKLGYVEFLREYGVHFTVNRMLAFDSVRLRLEREQPLSFLEFNYMLMQATDFLELHRRRNCVLQMGGSDQWGNIVNGVELIRRMAGAQAFGLTTPLLETSSGQKMGKTLGGAVWLNADRLGPYDYWQMWRNTEDADVGRFLRLFTELDLSEIARLERLGGAEINEAKKVLANEATSLLHGEAAAEAAAGAAKAAFEEGKLSGDLPTVEVTTLVGLTNATLMVQAGFASSNGDARRQIAGGGFRIDGVKIADANAPVSIAGAEAELRKGNARKRLVVTGR
ncbi:MAG TPA: tyrosine--tRNA ligase [Caulobacteraceae bacterium]|nr:tyrosine--tRNA ligase [Caulobacteraceae bacterium]